MSFKLKRFGRKGLVVITRRLNKPGTVEVGVIDAGTYDDSLLTVATIAFWQEFGTEFIPERSFMRATTREKREEIIALQKNLRIKIRKGEITTEQALGLLGEFMADLIRRKIVSLKEPANDPKTISAKGSSNPLVDLGHLKNSITYEVIK